MNQHTTGHVDFAQQNAGQARGYCCQGDDDIICANLS